MLRRDLVVIGASAGGVEAVKNILSGLPDSFAACVLLVVHRSATAGSGLPRVLGRAGPLTVKEAEEGDSLRPGLVLLAPPDRHLLVNDGRATLVRGPRENGHRPAVDVTLRTAAMAYGPRVVGVVCSGALDDGAAGSAVLQEQGGVVIAQDPDDALHPSMPLAAIEAAVVEHVVGAAKIPDLLTRLVGQDAPAAPAYETVAAEAGRSGGRSEERNDASPLDRPSGMTCPDCHGPLFDITEGPLNRYRCRVGHSWSPRSLAADQDHSVENALWTAMVALEEKATLRRELGRQARGRGHTLTSEGFLRSAERAGAAAAQIRELIERGASPPEGVR
jgi:two-component system chemotaxis response regulator CheB